MKLRNLFRLQLSFCLLFLTLLATDNAKTLAQNMGLGAADNSNVVANTSASSLPLSDSSIDSTIASTIGPIVEVIEFHRPVYFFSTLTGQWIIWSISRIFVPINNVLGILANVVNIIVFADIGMGDSVSVVFLGLSISDMLYSICHLINKILRAAESISFFHPYLLLSHLAFIINHYGRTAYDISILITVFVGLQKCACVAIPMTFRNFFTPRKSLIVVIAIYTCMIVYYLPQVTNLSLGPRFDSRFNRTRLGLKVANRQLASKMSRMVRAVNRISLPFIAEIILIICVAVMTFKLKDAAATRHSMTSGQEEKSMDKPADDDKGSKLSSKELRVIRSVNIVCVVFIAGTAPRCIIEACNLAFSNFGDFTVYESLYRFVAALQDIIVSISIAVNIIVYYKFNTKYRVTFQELFGKASQK